MTYSKKDKPHKPASGYKLISKRRADWTGQATMPESEQWVSIPPSLLSTQGSRVLQTTHRMATTYSRNSMDTQHLLLALLKEEDFGIKEALRRLQVNPEEVTEP